MVHIMPFPALCHHALCFPLLFQSSSLTTTQSHDLAVFLQLGDELITLLHDVRVSVEVVLANLIL